MKKLFDFQVGDLIFIKKRKDWMSKLIRYFSKGQYSHVEMIIGKFKYDNTDRLTISANSGSGVHLDTLNRYIKNNIQFDVYRYKDLNDLDKKYLFLNSKNYINLGYDYSGAIDLFAKVFKQAKNRYFCSELVARIYLDINKPILENKIQIYPSMLINSDKIYKVYDSEGII